MMADCSSEPIMVPVIINGKNLNMDLDTGSAISIILDQTQNQALRVELYLLPRPDDLLTTLAGGKCFSKLYLSQAYLQVPLDEGSRCYITVNTNQGLYHYTHFCFRC